MIARIKREPAVVIGILAAAILAGAQVAAGHDLLSGDAFAWLQKALNPDGGWAIPILVGVITRFFVSPAT
jgi:hypothetical protein